MKTFRLIGLAVAAMIMCPTMTSCGDDDDDDDKGGGNGNGSSITFDGRQLLSVGPYNFSYDNKGRCYKISNSSYSGEELTVDYNKGVVLTADGDEFKVKFNSKGYITEFYEKYHESGQDYTYNSESKSTMNYDKNGHIVSVKTTYKETGKDNGESYSESGEGKTTLTWTNGVMTDVKVVMDYVEDGEKGRETIDYKITYSSQENKFDQYTYNIAMTVLEFDEFPVAMAGFMGVGPSKIPTIVNETFNYDDEEYNITSSVTLNSDGTVASERISDGYGNSATLAYVYSSQDAPTLSRAAVDMDLKKMMPIKKRARFGMRRVRR